MEPFNISLLSPTKQQLKNVPEIKTIETYDGKSSRLHPEGLFSLEYFGPKGSELRDSQFSYIDFKTTILHPLIFQTFGKLKSLYKGIITGTDYAIWDEKENDFVRANELTGDTGFFFFVQYIMKIELKETDSSQRNENIKLIKENLSKLLVKYLLVIPPGYRDIEEGSDGRTTKDEINKKYQRAYSTALLLVEGEITSAHDSARRSLQMVFNEIYIYIKDMLDGKRGIIQSKFASRKIFNGTRNVLASKKSRRKSLYSDNAPGMNDTGVGLYQTMKGILPVTLFKLREMLSVCWGVGNEAHLIHPKTMDIESIELSTKEKDRWTTSEGLEKIINRFGDPVTRHRTVEIEGYYPFLIYRDDKHFAIVRDIENVTDEMKGSLKPITYAELMYLCMFDEWNRYRGWVTRYPVTGSGSMYPSRIYVYTTLKGERLEEITETGEPTGKVALEMPIEGMGFMDSLIPDSSHLAPLGAD
jgi:hypothetical protein